MRYFLIIIFLYFFLAINCLDDKNITKEVKTDFTYEINGFVLSNNKILPNSKVIVLSDKKVIVETKTDSFGKYSVILKQKGVYEVHYLNDDFCIQRRNIESLMTHKTFIY